MLPRKAGAAAPRSGLVLAVPVAGLSRPPSRGGWPGSALTPTRAAQRHGAFHAEKLPFPCLMPRPARPREVWRDPPLQAPHAAGGPPGPLRLRSSVTSAHERQSGGRRACPTSFQAGDASALPDHDGAPETLA